MIRSIAKMGVIQTSKEPCPLLHVACSHCRQIVMTIHAGSLAALAFPAYTVYQEIP